MWFFEVWCATLPFSSNLSGLPNENKDQIKEHIKTCPHGKSLLVSKTLLIGILIGVGLAGSGVGFTLAGFLL